MTDDIEPTLISDKATCRKTGLSKSTLWRLTKAGKFPKPVQISAGRTGRVNAEVDEWIKEKIAARDAA